MGISLQTLDDKQFDHGTILAQTPFPGLPIPPTAPLGEVLHYAATQGAEMLVQGLRDGVHIPPLRDVGWKATDLTNKELTHAPKVTKADSEVDWISWTTAEQFQRRMRVLGSVWTIAVNDKGDSKRLIFTAVQEATVEDACQGSKTEGTITCHHQTNLGEQTQQREVRVRIDGTDKSCFIMLDSDSWIRVRRVKVGGKPEQDAVNGLRSLIKLN